MPREKKRKQREAQKSFLRECRAYSEKSTLIPLKVKGEEAPKGGLHRKVNADTPKSKRWSWKVKGFESFPIFISTIHFIMSFTFINIHLDIYRIIIIPHKKDRCFGNEERLQKRKIFYALLCTKIREGVFRLRLKKEVSSTTKQIVHK
jgi:hypothetical protein